MKGKHFKIAMAGKITVGAGIFALLAIALLSTVGFVSTTADAAKSASTTVKVLNTPPQFATQPEEVVPSTIANPTNFGSTITFKVDAKDSSNNGMYLLICKTFGTATATANGAPTCPGGMSDQIAVNESPVTSVYPTPGTIYATSTPINDTVTETQNWFAYLCDDEAINPRCTKVNNHGVDGTDPASPYYINHPHDFTSLTNDGPKKPGETITFTASSTESMHKDVVGPADTIKMFMCKTAEFDYFTKDCKAGSWASSTAYVVKDSSAQFTIKIPYQDTTYSGYSYIIDSHGAAADNANGFQGKKIDFVVANAAPKVTEATIVFTSSTLQVLNPLGQTTNFGLNFETTDENSCKNATNGTEMKSVRVLLSRSGALDTAACQLGSAFDSNKCYTSDAGTAVWNLDCIQEPSSCTDATDMKVDWKCTFPLWSNVDPTDPLTPWSAEGWAARVVVEDDNTATGTAKITDSAKYAEVLSFPVIELASNSIDFGEFEPGSSSTILGATAGSILGVKSQGNTAFDLSMAVSDMCPGGKSCSGDETKDTILAYNQRYGTSSLAYSSALAKAGSTTPQFFDISIKKPFATGTPTSKDVYWGIAIPANLAISGDYKGVNNLNIVSEATLSAW